MKKTYQVTLTIEVEFDENDEQEVTTANIPSPRRTFPPSLDWQSLLWDTAPVATEVTAATCVEVAK